MLGFVSRFGSSKGMVAVPNLLGVATATANTQVTSAGLRVSSLSGARNTNVILEGGVSLAQTPAAGTLVDYETEVVITSGNYVADTVNVSVCQNYGTTTNDPDYCSGNVYVYGSARTKRRKTITTTNNVTGITTITFDNSCTDDVVSRGSEYINGQCGYVEPPKSCTATRIEGAYSACNAAYQVYSSGTQTRTVSGTGTNCQPYSFPESITCYQAVCGPWGDYYSINTTQERRLRFCQRTDGTTYFDYSPVRCKTSSSDTYSTCVNKKRTMTTKYYACLKLIDTVYTYNLPCNAL
jgi:hypothetical protein